MHYTVGFMHLTVGYMLYTVGFMHLTVGFFEKSYYFFTGKKVIKKREEGKIKKNGFHRSSDCRQKKFIYSL